MGSVKKANERKRLVRERNSGWIIRIYKTNHESSKVIFIFISLSVDVLGTAFAQ